MMTWQIWIFIALFVFHEIDEIVVLPPYAKKNAAQLRSRIPKRFAAVLEINRKAFSFIAIEELAVILLILWVSNGKWAWAVILVYLAHLLLHIAQSVALRSRGLAVPPLFSPLWQSPILIFLFAGYLPMIPISTLVFQAFIIGALAVVNLGLMHFIVRR